MNKSYEYASDRYLHLFGKLLLIEGLNRFGFHKSYLRRLCYNEQNKPFIPGVFDFNIAHSGKYAICAISTNGEIGIDIEQIREIDISGFNNVLSDKQLKQVQNSTNPLHTFYRLWTLKEAVIKASDLTLDDLEHIETDWQCAWLDNRKWYVQAIDIESNYAAHIAYENLKSRINKERIDI
ncbi:MAG: 4'-phosphopantetheinyl transferase superfamily protein [Bacteroidetes bacterium]|nr:4'-phosphopantetheinyl transferase superfamily protein [Bacteroidota bacterium]